jgi:hypothetical protein
MRSSYRYPPSTKAVGLGRLSFDELNGFMSKAKIEDKKSCWEL